jgi:hypothetical protein
MNTILNLFIWLMWVALISLIIKIETPKNRSHEVLLYFFIGLIVVFNIYLGIKTI